MADSDIFGQRVQTPAEEAWHFEQRRRMFDIIRVKNPTNQDFYVEYDINQHQRIPANSTIDIPRYIATRYVSHMKDKIVHDRSQKMHDDTVKERGAKGFPNYKSKWEENEETYNSADYPKSNDPKVIIPIINDLWVGLVYEFGKDTLPLQDSRSGEVNLTPVEQQVIEQMETKRVDPKDSPVIQQDFQSQAIQPAFTSTPVEKPGFMPQVEDDKPDFSSLNETLNQRVSADEVTNG
jgi:hypothetical protein